MSDVTIIIVNVTAAIPPSLLALAAYVQAKGGRSENAAQHQAVKEVLQSQTEAVQEVHAAVVDSQEGH